MDVVQEIALNEVPPAKTVKVRRRKGDRPCDLCRRRKIRCLMDDAQSSCALCRHEQRDCTFIEAAPKKKVKRTEEPAPLPTQASLESDAIKRSIPPPSPALRPPSSTAIPLNREGQTLVYYHGAPEHMGPTADFEELHTIHSEFPSFRNVSPTSPPFSKHAFVAHRIQTPSEVLDLVSTSRRELFHLVNPHGDRLVQLYFDKVWPIFPAVDKSRMQRYLRNELPNRNSPEAEVTIAPLVACLLVLGANWFPDKIEAKLDVTPLREYVSKVLRLDVKMPRQPTINALIMSVSHLAFGPYTNSLEIWSTVASLVGALQNLGMHIDCSSYKLEQWEKNARKRQWWFTYCAEKFFSHSLGRPSLIQQDSFSVPNLTEDDMEEGCCHHLIHLCQLAAILAEVLQVLYSPRTHSDFSDDPNRVLFTSVALVGRLDQWSDQLPLRFRMSALEGTTGTNSNGFLHLSYFAIRISVHRACLKCKRSESAGLFRTSAIQTATKMVEWATNLTAAHIRAFWPSWSTPEFSLASSFLLALLFTASVQSEFLQLHSLLQTWREALTRHSAQCENLVSLALSKMASCTGGMESPMDLWKQRTRLAIYQPATPYWPTSSPFHRSYKPFSQVSQVLPLYSNLAQSPISPPATSDSGSQQARSPGIQVAMSATRLPHDASIEQTLHPRNLEDSEVSSQTEHNQSTASSNGSLPLVHPPLANSADQFFWQMGPLETGIDFDLWHADIARLGQGQLGLLPKLDRIMQDTR